MPLPDFDTLKEVSPASTLPDFDTLQPTAEIAPPKVSLLPDTPKPSSLIPVKTPYGNTMNFVLPSEPDANRHVSAGDQLSAAVAPRVNALLPPELQPAPTPKLISTQPPAQSAYQKTLTQFTPEKLNAALSQPVYSYLPKAEQEALSPANIAAEIAAKNPSDRFMSALAGVEKGLGSTAEAFTSPQNAALMGTAGLGPAAQKAMGLIFGAQMVSQNPEIGKQLGEEYGKNPDQRDNVKIASLITEGLANSTLAAFGFKHAGEDLLTPEPPTPGAPNATQKRTQSKNDQQQYLGTATQRLPAETSGSNLNVEKQGERPTPTPNEARVEVRGDETLRQPSQPVSPHDFQPALMVDGKPVTGGDSHAEIAQGAIKSGDEKAILGAMDALADDTKHVFVDKDGKPYTRAETAKALNSPLGEKFQSSDLNDLKSKTPKPATPAPPAAPEFSPDQITKPDEAFASKGVTRPSLSAKYFHDAGDKTKNPDWWVEHYKRLAKGDIYAQETAYQAGLYLRQLGQEKAAPVIKALEEARAKMAEMADQARQKFATAKTPEEQEAAFQSPEYSMALIGQYPRESIEAAHDELSAKGVIPESVAKPLVREAKPSEPAPVEPPKAAPSQPVAVTPVPAAPVASNPIADALEKYEGTGEIETAADLVDHVEGLIAEGKAPESLQSAVDNYRQEQKDDRELAGRGDMDQAEENFINALKKSLRPAKAKKTEGIKNLIPLSAEDSKDGRLDEPGTNRKAKPNAITIQLRDRDSMPIRDIHIKLSGDDLTDAQNVVKRIANEMQNDPNVSRRESYGVSADAKGHGILHFTDSPNGPAFAKVDDLIKARAENKARREAAKPPPTTKQPWEMGREEFSDFSEGGQMRTATGKYNAAEKALKKNSTSLARGEAAGYSPADIARFYVARRGGDSTLAWQELVADAINDGKPVPDEVIKAVFSDKAIPKWISKRDKLAGKPAEKALPAPAEKKQGIFDKAREFNKLVRDYAHVGEWVKGQDFEDLQMAPPGTSNLGTIGIKADIARKKAVAKANQQVAKELGLDPTKIGQVGYRATHLDKLKALVAKMEQTMTDDQRAELEHRKAIDEPLPEGVSTDFLPPEEKPAFTLDQPESVEQQQAREAKEAADRQAQAGKEKLAAGAAKKLVGSVGDIGQTDFAGGGDLFSTTIKKAEKWADDQIAASKKMGVLPDRPRPELMAAYAVKGALWLSRGVRDFGEWSKRMVEEYGSQIRPFLNEIYRKATSGDLADDLTEFKALDPQSGADLKAAGMGAARPEEFRPVKDFTTSNKNAVVDKERADRGADEIKRVARQDFGTVWDDAMQRIDDDPTLSQRLENDIYTNGRPASWMDTDTQNAILLHRRIETTNSLNKALADLNQHIADGFQQGIDEARIRSSQLSDELNRLDQTTRVLGTQLGRGLNARKMLAKQDYSLAAMESKMRGAKNGEELTDAERQQIADLNKKIVEQREKYEKHIAELEEKLAKGRVQGTFDNLVEQAKSTKAAEDANGEERDFEAEQEALIGGLQKKADAGKTLDQVGNWIQRIARLLVEMGERDAGKLTSAVHDIVKDIFPDATRNDVMNAISGYGDFKELSKDEISVEFRRMKGELQQLGKIEDMNAGQAPLKTGVERRTPSQLERTRIKIVNEMKRKLGLNVTDPARQLQSALGAIKTRLQHQIEDLDLQIASGKKILKSKTPTVYDAEANALKAKRDLLKEKFDAMFGRPELTDEQRIAIATKSLDRQIEEVQRQMRTGEIFPKGKQPSKTPSTPALEAKRAELDALKQERDYLRDTIQPPAERDPVAIALQSAKTRLKNRTADLLDRMARGDYSKKPRRPVELDKAGQALRVKYEDAKLDFDREVMRQRLQNRTPFEKAMDGLSKWRRAFVLTYPTILAKLTSASLELIGITPAEEAVGSALRRFPVLSQVAEKSPRYGAGFQSKVEADALAHTWQTLFTETGKKLRTGKSDIDTLYGDPRLVPQELKDYILNIHSALKEPARQNEFVRSFAKRAEFAGRQGADISDPAVQAKIGMQAYKDANAKIFLENNSLADAVNRGLSRFAQRDPKTGRVAWSGKAIETGIRYELPIIKIPLNLVKRSFEYSFGTVVGGVRLARALSRGLDNLTQDESDVIMRNLARGSLGAAVLALGFFNPQAVGGYYQQGQKRGKSDVAIGGLRIFGHDIPRVLIHNPLLEQLQIGSTLRRAMDAKIRGTHEKQGFVSGTVAAYGGLVEETPFVQQAEESLKALNPAERQQFFGELMKSAVPGVVQWAAQQMDQQHLTPAKFITGTPTARKPVTAGQYLKMAIPGLRETVPAKKN